MRNFKNALFLLLTGVVFLFSACEDQDGDSDVLDIPGEIGQYDLQTLTPDINNDRVLFQASLNTQDSRVKYGFMWYVKPTGDEAAVVHTVPVGNGQHRGVFSIPMASLPKNVALVVCSYVELGVGGNETQQIAEELDFGWD